MKFTRFVLVAAMLFAVALPALAQNPTGTLTGRANDGKDPLPGVTVTVTSPNLQGARTAVTEVTGAYLFPFLPAGDYHVRFELMGFQTLDTTIKINAAQTSTLNASMPTAKVAEEVTVTGTYDNISSGQQVATTYDQSLINTLPVARGITSAAILTPGVATTGPSGYLSISGAMSYENLYMVNGVVIQDNVRNTPNVLYIEDAIQETTTQTAAISAEYGRFAGGIVNTLTKSGGNEFHAIVPRLALQRQVVGQDPEDREPQRQDQLGLRGDVRRLSPEGQAVVLRRRPRPQAHHQRPDVRDQHPVHDALTTRSGTRASSPSRSRRTTA